MRPDLIVRLLQLRRGELEPREEAELRSVLERNGEARGWERWIEELHRAAVREDAVDERANVDDAALPDPIEVAALVEGKLADQRAEEVREALASSVLGLELLESALDEARVGAADSVRTDRRASPRPFPLRLVAFATAAAALAAVVWTLFDDRASVTDVAALASRQPLAVPELRSVDEELASGYRAYSAGDWRDAATRFASAESSGGRACESALYLGSALLLEGRDADALAALRRAQAACEGSFLDEAQWQLAQANLALGDRQSASDALARVAARGGRRAADARRLLERLAD